MTFVEDDNNNNNNEKAFNLDDKEDKLLADRITAELTKAGLLYGKDFWFSSEGVKMTPKAALVVMEIAARKRGMW